MGEVYRARDTRLGREVAIKVSAQQFTERFEREARAVAALNHSNICHLYDVATSPEGFGYLVMELVEGDSPKGPLPVEEVSNIARQIAAALEAAHEKGIIHRDLKPANIKITHDGVVKVLDFGLAKIETASEPTSANSPTITMNATQAGMILGTAAYMSPEQARGKRVDKRSDIWSFGVVLYELLTGDQVFGGETVADTLIQVATKEPDWNRVPASVEPLLRKCLERDPAKRLRDIGDMDLLLRPVTQSPPAIIERRRAVWIPWTVAGALALAAGVFAFLWLRPAPLPQAVQFEIHAPAGSTLLLGTPAVSPNGQSIVFAAADSDGKRRLHLRPMDRVDSLVVPGTEGAQHPFWSPDGRSLAFAANNILKRVDLAGGPARDLATITGPWHGTWGQLGDILIQGSNGLQRVSQDGGPVTLVPGVGAGHPYFLPDGKRFLFWTGISHGSIQLATLGSESHSMVLDEIDSTPVLAETPGGKNYLLFMRDSDLFAQEFEPKAGVLRGSATLVASNVGRVANPRVKPAVGVSPAGVLAYQMGILNVVGQLTWFDRSGKPQGSLPADLSGQGVHLSPDGLSVAMSRMDATGNEDVWLTDLTRKSLTRLSFAKARDLSPVWSPDANRVAFVEIGGGQPKIYIVDAHDAGVKQNLRISTANPKSWSPDGKFLLADANGDMSLIPVSGTDEPVKAGSANGMSGDGRFSPDGKYIAFASDQSGRQEVYVERVAPASGEWKVSIDGGSAPRWRKDGKELFFVSAAGAMMVVDIKGDMKPGDTLSAGIPRQLFAVEGLNLTDYDVRADGKQFLVFVPQRQKQDFPITVVLNWWVEIGK